LAGEFSFCDAKPAKNSRESGSRLSLSRKPGIAKMIELACKDELLKLKSVKTGGAYGGFDTLHGDKPTNGAAVRGRFCMENSAAAVPIEKLKFFDGLSREFGPGCIYINRCAAFSGRTGL